ncbi:M60 family metallopeptidase [Streptomyces lavendulae]|uniref:M60 family metallopeptidase n=1 Tax=Streptomyces lavendulae TaxID=1914 RepID=UPI0031EB04D7
MPVVELGDAAVRAPYVVLGESSPDQHRWMLDTYGSSPQAELVSPYTIVTVDRAAAQEFRGEDQVRLMTVYEEITELHDAYNSIPGTTGPRRRSPLRHHLTLGTTGNPHASNDYTGYPRGQRSILLTPEGLRNNGWVVHHELGHHHQLSSWARGGHFTESAVNIYSMATQRAFGRPPRLLQPFSTGQVPWERALQRRQEGWSFGAMDVWDRLCAMEQLVLAFGADFYPRMHRLMREEAVSPASGAAPQYRNWAVYASRVCGRDLRDFFSGWGMELTADDQRAIARLRLPRPTADFSTRREYRVEDTVPPPLPRLACDTMV